MDIFAWRSGVDLSRALHGARLVRALAVEFLLADLAGVPMQFFALALTPLHGVREDPATGSANAALRRLLAGLRPEPYLVLDLPISQGVERGRPSLLEATAEKPGRILTRTQIGGRCVMAMTETITV